MVVYTPSSSPWLWGAPKTVILVLTSTLLTLSHSPIHYIFLHLYSTWYYLCSNPRAISEAWVCWLEMCAEWVQAGFEAYRPCGVVHLRRICPSFSLPALRFRPPLHIVLLLHEMDSQTRVEWEVWGPSHGKPPVWELDPRIHCRLSNHVYRSLNIHIFKGLRNLCWERKNTGAFWQSVRIFGVWCISVVINCFIDFK